jgi:hypothetical protein
MLASGHFHFRVKTVAPQGGDGRREDVDPRIMPRITEAVHDSEPSPEATVKRGRRRMQCRSNAL